MAGTAQPREVESAPVERVPGTDLKSRLTEALAPTRKPGQILRVTQVTPNHFRVNYLSPAIVAGEASVMRSYRISKSQFLRVEELEGELVITDQTRK